MAVWPARTGPSWCRFDDDGDSEVDQRSDRYPLGRCSRCRRDQLPIQQEEGLCRGYLVFVREYGREVGRHTQLTFAGGLALQLSTKAGVLGFTPRRNSGLISQERARRRAAAAPQSVSPHLVDPTSRRCSRRIEIGVPFEH